MNMDEIETIINISKYHIGDWAEVYTTDKSVMSKYTKFANSHPEQCKIIHQDAYSMTFSVNPKCIAPRAPRKVSEEQRLASAERLRTYRSRTHCAQ